MSDPNRTMEQAFLENELRQLKAIRGQDPTPETQAWCETVIKAAMAFDAEPINLQGPLVRQVISEEAAQWILKVALKRKAWEKRKGWNLKLGGIQRSVQGVAGELVAARWAGLEVDTAYYAHGDQWDLEDKDKDYKFQVRYTPNSSTRFYQRHPTMFADIGVLVRGAGLPTEQHDLGVHHNKTSGKDEKLWLHREAVIAGWINTEDWDAHNYSDPQHGRPGWCVPNEVLRDPEEKIHRDKPDMDVLISGMKEALGE